MTDAVDIRYRPPTGPHRRVRFEQTSEGWVRREYVWTGCRWRPTGAEPLNEVVFEAGGIDTIDGEEVPQ